MATNAARTTPGEYVDLERPPSCVRMFCHAFGWRRLGHTCAAPLFCWIWWVLGFAAFFALAHLIGRWIFGAPPFARDSAIHPDDEFFLAVFGTLFGVIAIVFGLLALGMLGLAAYSLVVCFHSQWVVFWREVRAEMQQAAVPATALETATSVGAP